MIRDSLVAALEVTAWVFVTLWLCLNVSWWFSAVWVFGIVYVAVRLILIMAERYSDPNNISKNAKQKN